VAKTRVADKGAQGPSRLRADKEWGGEDEDDSERESARRHGKTFEIKREAGKGEISRQGEVQSRTGKGRREGDSRIRVNKNAALHERSGIFKCMPG